MTKKKKNLLTNVEYSEMSFTKMTLAAVRKKCVGIKKSNKKEG